MDAPKLERARLIPLDGDQPSTDLDRHIEVQFNPATLRITLANTLRPARGGGAAQYIDKSESALSLELVFDTSVDAVYGDGTPRRRTVDAQTDVRSVTRRIAEAFMNPEPAGAGGSTAGGRSGRGGAGRGGPRAPTRCCFQWGAFQFRGMVASYAETLDFFSPEGIPLRATVALGLKEDRYQFEQLATQAAARQAPAFAASGGQSAAEATRASGGDPRDWRLAADANGLDNPRFTPPEGLLLPGAAEAPSPSLPSFPTFPPP
jgi:hypothetical protein